MINLAIVSKLKPFAIRVKTLIYGNGKEFAAHGLIDKQTVLLTLPGHLLAGSVEAMRTSTDCYANTFQRS
jgi:hypothetical protein